MFSWDNNNLGKALGVDIVFSFKAKRIVTDSRKIGEGDLFVALKGDNFDGNKFAEEALKKGAIAAIVDDKKLKNDRFINVENSLAALQRIGRYRRKNSKAKFVAITGSVGKTGTKEMIHAALSTKYKTYKTEGNLNNHIGLPLTLANMPDDVEFAVLELGMNHSGEISELVRICNPNLAGITWVGESHIQNLGSRENIAYAKAEIFEWLVMDGHAVIPGDNEFFDLLHDVAESNGIQDIYSFGQKANAVEKTSDGVKAHIFDEQVTIPNAVIENHVLNNVLLALTIASLCEVNLKSAIKAIAEMDSFKGRGGKIVLKNGAVLIDDSYNASPASMHLALQKLVRESAKRKIAALGEMKELGEFSQKYHEELAEHLQGVDMLVTCGNDMKFLYNKVNKKLNAKHFESIPEVYEFLKGEAKKGDVVLVKGSHGSNMWKVVDLFSQ
jgi:UDP-N-acetylmuramoyl-tripeptide--D-alanyl-D-alanine ligase